MERLERNTTAVEEQVSRLRSHLLGAAAVLRDRSRNLLSEIMRRDCDGWQR